MPRMTARQRAKLREQRKRRFEQRRIEYPRRVMMFWKEVVKERAEATAKLASFKAYRGDLHIHSNYSDGAGTVHEIKAYADATGLDFAFVTDHRTVNQKRVCQKYERLWWGQEPGLGGHHLLILGLDRKYTPVNDVVRDYNRVQELGAVAVIPHPAGWFPTRRNSQEILDLLDGLGDEFRIEIINGANQIFDCFDVTDEMAIGLWDKHLCQGKRVTGIGATDAHLAEAVGDVWTGVFAPRCAKTAILKALRDGHCFASDSPLIRISIGGAAMGDIAWRRKGSLTLRFECADSRGLDRVRVIKDGRLLKQIDAGGDSRVTGSLSDRFGGGKSYYRVECFAVDERRAYSGPIYVWHK